MDPRWVSSAYKVEDTMEQIEAEMVMLCRGCPAILHSQTRSMAQGITCGRERCCKESKVCI